LVERVLVDRESTDRALGLGRDERVTAALGVERVVLAVGAAERRLVDSATFGRVMTRELVAG
jgi:hypothetical protein